MKQSRDNLILKRDCIYSGLTRLLKLWVLSNALSASWGNYITRKPVTITFTQVLYFEHCFQNGRPVSIPKEGFYINFALPHIFQIILLHFKCIEWTVFLLKLILPWENEATRLESYVSRIKLVMKSKSCKITCWSKLNITQVL